MLSVNATWRLLREEHQPELTTWTCEALIREADWNETRQPLWLQCHAVAARPGMVHVCWNDPFTAWFRIFGQTCTPAHPIWRSQNSFALRSWQNFTEMLLKWPAAKLSLHKAALQPTDFREVSNICFKVFCYFFLFVCNPRTRRPARVCKVANTGMKQNI